VPGFHRHSDAFRDVKGQQRLAGARLAFDEQRSFQGDRTIDGIDEDSDISSLMQGKSTSDF
jgi:hypothetical protein